MTIQTAQGAARVRGRVNPFQNDPDAAVAGRIL